MPTPTTPKPATESDVKNKLLNALNNATPGTPEFKDLLEQYNMFRADTKSRSGIEPWIPVIGNIGGVSVMGLFEAFGHIFASKSTQLFGNKHAYRTQKN